jgi:hypothetical protein
LFATDVLEVLYAPHKVFKKIMQNPKYWGPLLVIILFTASQTALYYAQYSKTYYEETSPILSQLPAWTQNPSYWVASPNTTRITLNEQDALNTTFHGNASLQFAVSNSSSLSMNLKNFTSVNCGADGFPDLYLQLKPVEPQTAPMNVTLYLYSAGSTSYFQYDLTPSLANLNLTEWNNFTIPVGPSAANWQSSGNPTWGDITGLKLDVTFPESADISVRIGGLFFRGEYKNPIDVLGQGFFAANAILSGLFTFVSQWIILSAVAFIIIKVLKGNITWRPLFIAFGFASIIFVVQTLIAVAATATMPAQIYYPYEFGYSFQTSYSPNIVALFSSASQATYNTTIAPAVSTAYTVSTIVALFAYAWMTLLAAAITRAATEFSWVKSLLVAAGTVVLMYVILSILYVVLQL